jgi:LPXTG-motif cell wall-anchored protein
MASSETGEQQMLLVYLAVLLLLGLGGVYVLFMRSKPPVASSEPKADVAEPAGGDRRRGGALDKMKRRQPMAGVTRRSQPDAVALRSWLSLLSPLK